MRKQFFFALAVLVTLLTSCSTIQEFNEFRKEKAKQNSATNTNQNSNVSNNVDNQTVNNQETNDDEVVSEEDLTYDDEYEEINPNDPDSIQMQMQQMFDDENSGVGIVDESVELLEHIDTLQVIPYFEGSLENTCNYPPGYIPSFPDSVYAKRIEELNRNTTIDLVYNKHVKSFIDVYAVQKRSKTERILGLSDVYFPLFEQMLDKYNMPLELKYLAVVESALNPTAGSWAGAKGLWQFMYATGKQYGLNSNTLVDDRYDPLKATDAACRHLRDLYNQFGDWFLALAAYNSGAGNVNKAIRRSGGIKNYWAIWPYLPRETRGYVPAFIAVNYVMNYAPEHNICPLDPGIIKNGTDTVTVHDVLHFDQLNEMLGVPMADLKFFNPQYKAEIIPASSKKPYLLTLPNQYVESYIDHEKELYTYKTKSGIDKDKLQERIKSMSDRSVHVVKKGETLSTIARKYHVSVNQLKQWNNMKSDRLSIGQKLVVYSSGAPMAQVGNDKPVERSTTQITHTVKKGETLGKIAQKYKCTVTDLKRWNNLKSTNIQVGQKLKVYPPENQNVSGRNNSNNKPASSSNSTTTYTVKSGDSLWSIAKKFNVTVDHIKKLNNLKNNDIKVGQKLKI
ncbi:MAG: LysM peptidoglycan-binding domain-containing protein [Bacteroidales bacterium]|nr:LysM peptidoglycan-binding domain-containing protein [Bacteroidales bacterium]